jgi:hypothetical protein
MMKLSRHFASFNDRSSKYKIGRIAKINNTLEKQTKKILDICRKLTNKSDNVA